MVNNNCDQLSELLDAYHDGELADKERETVAEHVSECSACNNRLVDISRLVRNLKALPRLRPARDIVDSIDFEKLLATPQPTANPSIPVASSTAGASKSLKIAKQNVVQMRSRAVAGGLAGAVAAVAVVFAALVHKPGPETHLANAPVGRPIVVATNPDSSAIPDYTPAETQNRTIPSVATSSTATTVNRDIAPQIDRALKTAPQKLERVTEVKNKSLIAEGTSEKPIASVNTSRNTIEAGEAKPMVLEIAVLTDEDGAYDSLGFATDEDGLYDIKI